MSSLAIYIPAYNVGHTLPRVLERIPQVIYPIITEILIVDNASNDNTYITAVGWKNKLKKINIIQHKENKGYGGSQKIAYLHCIEKGYDYVVMLHGDAQYAPEFIPQLQKKIEETKADLVFGSRIKGKPLQGGMPIWRYIGNRILTIMENIILQTDLSEFHSGYRIYRLAALKNIPFERCSNNYYFDSEILVQMRICGLKIEEIEIPTHYAKDSQSPTVIQTFYYGLAILIILLKYLLHKWHIKKYAVFDVLM
jgi:glycosyltransferase involved in cell wall biosynthesis